MEPLAELCRVRVLEIGGAIVEVLNIEFTYEPLLDVLGTAKSSVAVVDGLCDRNVTDFTVLALLLLVLLQIILQIT